MLGGGHHFRSAQEALLIDSGRELREIRGRYRTIDDEERLIEELLPRFRALQAKGIIGHEARLDWIETLRAASRRLGLPELRYSIRTQERLQTDFPVETTALGVYRSLMELHLGLLHEEDLLGLFALMDREARGLYSVSSCRVRRAGAQLVYLPAAVNLQAMCVLDWFSLREPEA